MPSHQRCAFEGCINTKETKPDLSFHRFPVNTYRRADWISRSGNIKLRNVTRNQMDNTRICSEHFTVDQIQWREGKIKLKYDAVPEDNSAMHDLKRLNENENNVGTDITNNDLQETDSSVESIVVNLNLPSVFDLQKLFSYEDEISNNIKLPGGSDVSSRVYISQKEYAKLIDECERLKEENEKKDKLIKMQEQVSRFQLNKLKTEHIKLKKVLKSQEVLIKSLTAEYEKRKAERNLMKTILKLDENLIKLL